ncbi:hypothetical protein BYT27DRAFT_7185726 [Phlegmacium glaucopus]|nr:hypothetical protein BYT27DRAFT_7185726 [Phlegmacium glaucopus]
MNNSPNHLLSGQVPNLLLDGTIAARRHPDTAVILMVGNSGHGKSKTINRLVGRNLLDIGRSTLGSTTKTIQRVTIPLHNKEAGVAAIAIDDTPGLDDTTYSHRYNNDNLMRQYKKVYFPDPISHSQTSPVINPTFPHVILLVATWDSITPDAHNDPAHFTSAVGKSISNLTNSGLVDLEYPNIIIVVTKSMSYWYQLDDYESEKEKSDQWSIEAGTRKTIILDLQRRAFPKSTPWPVVFIENGGGSKMDAPHPILPDGQLSHQNLVDAISNVIHDLVGAQALRLLTGADFLDSAGKPETLLSPGMTEDTIIESSPVFSLVPSPSDRNRELAEEYLGIVYNPIRGAFGRTSVLEFNPSHIEVERFSDHQPKDFRFTNQDHDPTASLLNVADLPRYASLSSHYSSSFGFDSAKSEKSELYVLHMVTAVAKIRGNPTKLSKDMITRINRLPPLPATLDESSQSMQQYHDFFESHGTHVVLCVALGGLLRVVLQAMEEPNTDGRLTKQSQVMIFRDGGGAVASRLTLALEQNFREPSSVLQSDWTNVCMEWVKEVENDPVFCPDDGKTEYHWLYELGGLTKEQKEALKRASESYLRPRRLLEQQNTATMNGSTGGVPRRDEKTGELKNLDRQMNLAKVLQKLEKLLVGAFKGSNRSAPAFPSKAKGNCDIPFSIDKQKEDPNQASNLYFIAPPDQQNAAPETSTGVNHQSFGDKLRRVFKVKRRSVTGLIMCVTI